MAITTSAQVIITDALQKLGVYAPNETLSDADLVLGLAELNNLVDQWLDDSIFLFQISQLTANIVIGQQSYLVGIGGAVNFPRPRRVTLGPGVATMLTPPVNGVLSLVDSVSAIEWDSIYSRAAASPSAPATPSTMFYDAQYPFGLLSVAPLPSAAGILTFDAWYGFTNFPAAATSFSFPPGQIRAMESNLALMLNPYFGGTPVTPELFLEAVKSKMTLALTNRASRAQLNRDQPPTVGRSPSPGPVPAG